MNTVNADETRKLIVIIGFMGSGKTTVARELARLLRCRAIDLDEFISQREDRSPGQIIEQSGEGEFRRIETEVLGQLLLQGSSGLAAQIISLGGGTWTLPRNRDLINEHMAITIWLDAPFDLCWRRIQKGREGRPLARDETQARMLHAMRRPQYALAELHIQVGTNKGTEEICVEIAEALRIRNR